MSTIGRVIASCRKDGIEYTLRKAGETLTWKILPEVKTKRIVAESRVLTTLYYYIRGSFYHEQRTILHGQRKYKTNKKGTVSAKSRVIRQTHRIEKGLSMRDRRSVFAEGYIYDLVDQLEDLCASVEDKSLTEHTQLCWSIDVLANYFTLVDETKEIKRARLKYESLVKKYNYEPGNQSPQKRQYFEYSEMSLDELYSLARQRTSTRWFQSKEVPRKSIDNAIKVAAQSPSACNRQSFEFRIYDEEELISEISELPLGATGYRNNIPCLVVLVGKQSAYFHDRDRHVIYIDASLAAMAFQFGLETQGLASCCINWPALPTRENRINELLNLESDEQVIMMLAVGYPDPEGKVPFSAKKDISDIRSYNQV